MTAAMKVEEIGRYYTVIVGSDEIRTTATSSGDTVESWIDEIRTTACVVPSNLLDLHTHHDHLVVGFGVEWSQNIPAALTFCVGRRCLIFHIIRADRIPDALADFLGNQSFRFVGVETRGFDYRGIRVDGPNVVDLRHLASEKTGRREMNVMRLDALAAEIMKVCVSLPETVTMSCWDEPHLTHGQVAHSCADAFLSFQIAKKLYEMSTTPSTQDRPRGNGADGAGEGPSH